MDQNELMLGSVAPIFATIPEPEPGSDCHLKNTLVIGPQTVGRLPVVAALTVNAHLGSLKFTHSEGVCCYLQPTLQSRRVPLHSELNC